MDFVVFVGVDGFMLEVCDGVFCVELIDVGVCD